MYGLWIGGDLVRISSEMGLEQYADLMRKHQEEAVAMSKCLGKLPIFKARAERMSKCGIYTRGLYCPKCKSFHTTRSSLCRDRLCPNCGWALSRKRARAVLYAVDHLSELQSLEVLHLVLTLKHDTETRLRDQLEALCKNVGKMLRYSRIKRYMLGYVRSIEIKKGNAGFHPHAHVLLVMSPDYNRAFIPQKDWIAMWRLACGLDYDPVVWIKKAYACDQVENTVADAIYECVKYTIKTSEWEQMTPEELYIAADAIHGRKLFSVAGALYEPYMMRMEEKDDPVDEAVTPCKKCGSNRFIATINL